MPTARRTDAGKSAPPPRPLSELMDRQPPFDLQAEIGVLGSIVLLPDVLDDVILLVRPDDFYDDAHRKLFVARSTDRDCDPAALANGLAADLQGAGLGAEVVGCLVDQEVEGAQSDWILHDGKAAAVALF